MGAYRSPAKVNLSLHVLGVRADGYHDLHSLFLAVDLCDDLSIDRTPRDISVQCDSPDVPAGEENLAYRAARSFLQVSGAAGGARITIAKRIPVGAGLGGGSSNAGTVLTALQELCGHPLADSELKSLAASLGADVPFFLRGGAAHAGGIGDILTPVRITVPLWLVLVNPGFPVPTKWAYERLDTLRATGDLPGPRAAGLTPIPRRLTSLEEIQSLLHNDLEGVTAGAYPVIGRIIKGLQDAGAQGAMMSGSGPTVFGLFRDGDICRKAAEAMQARGWWSRGARGLHESQGE